MPRNKKCRSCGNWFQPFSSLHRACSLECSLEVARKDAEKRERKKHRQDKERIKTRSEIMKEAQQAFNAWIRERDRDYGCISCDKGPHWQGRWNASHYRSVGACPELRFDENNVHKACMQCNAHKSGNILEYRIGLIKRYGQNIVDYLEGPHGPKRYSKEELREIKRKYNHLTRQLQKLN